MEELVSKFLLRDGMNDVVCFRECKVAVFEELVYDNEVFLVTEGKGVNYLAHKVVYGGIHTLYSRHMHTSRNLQKASSSPIGNRQSLTFWSSIS